MKTFFQRCALLTVVAAVAISGCGPSLPKRVPVSGRVLIDGKPLVYGVIQVIPADGRPAMAQLGPDGRFTLTTFDDGDGCLLGKHRVVVVAREEKSPTTFLWHVPKKYFDPSTSGLEVEITGPTNDLEFKLTWDGGKPFIEKLY